METLTVIIPNYNKAKYLSHCVNSVLQQSIYVNEIIVVDDKSTDNSLEVLEAIKSKDSRLKIIPLDKNRGVSHARNIGARMASSKYITFLDSDDFYYNPQKLENEMLVIKRCIDAIAYSKYQLVGVEGNPLPSPDRIFPSGYCAYSWMKSKGDVRFARDYILKKDQFLEAGQYEEGCSFYEDFDLLLRLAMRYPFICTNELGTAYRQVPNGLSKKTKADHENAKRRIREKYLNKFGVFQQIRIKLEWIFWTIYRKIRRL